MICMPVAARCRKKCVARYRPLMVSSRLMMWILWRLPWMYGCIFGFHRLAWWP